MSGKAVFEDQCVLCIIYMFTFHFMYLLPPGLKDFWDEN